MTTFPPFHLPFLFYHSHSTSLPFLSLFLSLSSSSSPFSYKQQPHSSHQFTPQWGGTNPPLSLLHHIFHSLVFRVLKASRRRKGGCTITIITINFVHHHHHLAAHGLDYLLSRIQGFVVFKSSCYSIWCNLTFPLIILMNSSLLLDYSLYQLT